MNIIIPQATNLRGIYWIHPVRLFVDMCVTICCVQMITVFVLDFNNMWYEYYLGHDLELNPHPHKNKFNCDSTN